MPCAADISSDTRHSRDSQEVTEQAQIQKRVAHFKRGLRGRRIIALEDRLAREKDRKKRWLTANGMRRPELHWSCCQRARNWKCFSKSALNQSGKAIRSRQGRTLKIRRTRPRTVEDPEQPGSRDRRVIARYADPG